MVFFFPPSSSQGNIPLYFISSEVSIVVVVTPRVVVVEVEVDVVVELSTTAVVSSIISIFAGRAGDVGKDPVPEFVKSIKLAKKFKNVEILCASVREPYNYLQAKQLGCHIITVPPTIIEKIENFGKSFDQLTKETVKAFLVDSKKSVFKI